MNQIGHNRESLTVLYLGCCIHFQMERACIWFGAVLYETGLKGNEGGWSISVSKLRVWCMVGFEGEG